ncbi:MAG: FAD-binding oxidoreductase [Candidatus Thermoplasmatota archaeon]|nr:FAD-binding oxidoreductase [Candidatus Thermoplasmatota archaeon]
MPLSKYDVIVVGAGIVGLTSAYHMKLENPDLRILVVDRAPTFAQGNTAKSAAGFRDLFSSDENFKLSSSTISQYRSIQESGKFDLGMNFVGYMFLMGPNDPRKNLLMELSDRTKIEFLDRDELASYPYLSLNPTGESAGIMNLPSIESAAIGKNCGIIEPELIAQFYYDECIRIGVEFSFSTEVSSFRLQPVNPIDFPGEPFLWQDKTLRTIETNRGDLTADIFIAATDTWTTALLDPTGIDSHIRPKKRQIFQTGGEEVEKILFGWERNSDGVLPFTIVPSRGVYIRPAPRYRSLWLGVADDYNRDFSFTENPEAERSFYDYNLSQIITSYFPSLTEQKVTGMWAGYYSYNTVDKTPYIFRDLNIIVATGTSGSGILKGDAIGRVVSALYAGKETARLHGGQEIKVDSLGVHNRSAASENLVL